MTSCNFSECGEVKCPDCYPPLVCCPPDGPDVVVRVRNGIRTLVNRRTDDLYHPGPPILPVKPWVNGNCPSCNNVPAQCPGHAILEILPGYRTATTQEDYDWLTEHQGQ